MLHCYSQVASSLHPMILSSMVANSLKIWRRAFKLAARELRQILAVGPPYFSPMLNFDLGW